jgi:coenzyme F420 hydrogenase subunit beta
MGNKGFADLLEEVVGKGLCCGCGACAGICPTGAVAFDYSYTEPQPMLAGNCISCGLCSTVCPGRDVPLKDIDEKFMGRARDFEKDIVGICKGVYKGRSGEPSVSSSSASGGIVSGLLRYAFESGQIDGALVLGWNTDAPYRAAPMLIRSADEVMTACRWTAEVVPVLESLNRAVYKEKLKHIAVVGMPCQIHAVRKIQMNGPKRVADAIAFSLGLFCAATYYFEGIKHLILEFSDMESLEDVRAVDYRGGQAPGSFVVIDHNNKVMHVATKHDYTWHFLGPASYKRDRCLMCVDFAAEAADVSCGDVFYPIQTVKNTVCAITRTDVGEELLQKAAEKGYVTIEPHDAKYIPSSGMGWESKKHAGAYRLQERKRFGWPVPDFQYQITEQPLKRPLSFPK